VSEEPRFAPNVDPRRVAALPSVGRLTTIGALAVLVPGIVIYVILHVAAGMSTGVSGLIGLVGCFAGLIWYPTYLRKLGKRLDAQLQPPADSPVDREDA